MIEIENERPAPAANTFAPLDPVQHQGKAWRAPRNAQFAAHLNAVLLSAGELPQALSIMPIAFAKAGEGYAVIGIMSLRASHNVFVHPDGRWLGTYMPAALRNYPFRLLKPTEASPVQLCISDPGGFAAPETAGAQPLFDDKGSFSEPTRQMLEALTAFERDRAVLDRAVAALAKADLIQPWDIRFSIGDKTLETQGYYRVNEKALNELPAGRLHELMHVGALHVAFAQMLSMYQLTALKRLVDQFHAGAAAAPTRH